MIKITHFLLNNLLITLVIFTSIILYIFTLFFVHNDVYFTYRWVTFTLYVEVLAVVITGWFLAHFKQIKFNIKHFFKTKEINLILILLILTVCVNFLFIAQYPYVSIADEMRDSGLWAKKFLEGSVNNIFSYGSYNGYGLISATFTIPFYLIFGNSVLTYRVLAALLATLDIPLLYILVRYNFHNKHIAFWSALTLASLPLHIFFAHTESLIAFDSFWSIVLFILFSVWLKNKNLINYILLGTIIGFVANFHTSVRIVALLTAGLAIFVELISIKKSKNFRKLFNSFGRIVILIAFCFIGFGPTIFFSSSKTFFQSDRYIYSKNAYFMTYSSLPNMFDTFHTNYIKSLMVWFYEPTVSHYADHKPILTPFMAIFFMLGIGYGLFILKKPLVYISLFFLFILAFTNSAMTDTINADHRLAPLFSIGALFVGIGITYSIQSVKYLAGKIALIIIVTCYLLLQASLFFINRPADKQFDLKQYLDMNIYYFLNEHKQIFMPTQYTTENVYPTNNICVVVSQDNAQLLNSNNIAIIEQTKYFLSNVDLQFTSNQLVKDNEAYVRKGSCESNNLPKTLYVESIDCYTGYKLKCPLSFRGQMYIFY